MALKVPQKRNGQLAKSELKAQGSSANGKHFALGVLSFQSTVIGANSQTRLSKDRALACTNYWFAWQQLSPVDISSSFSERQMSAVLITARTESKLKCTNALTMQAQCQSSTHTDTHRQRVEFVCSSLLCLLTIVARFSSNLNRPNMQHWRALCNYPTKVGDSQRLAW